MQVRINLMSALRKKLPPGSAGGVAQVNLPPGSSITAALETLGIEMGHIHLVTVNGDMEADKSRLLQDGDELVVFPPVAGGCDLIGSGHPQAAAQAQPRYDRIDQFRADLLATEAEPAEITPWMRAKLLLGHGLFAALGIMAFSLVFFFLVAVTMTFMPSGEELLEWIGATAMVISAAVFALFLLFLPVYLTRGGISMVRAGIAAVRADGHQASGLHCLWRAFLAWGVIAVLAALAVAGIAIASYLPWLGYGILGAAVVLFAGYVALILRNPARAPHDMLAGTYLVPR